MTDIALHKHCTRPWYMRPPVWVLGAVVIALIVFGIVETAGRPTVTPYGSFLDQLDAGNVASVTFKGTEIDGRFKHAVGDTASNGGAQQSFRSRVPEFGDPTLLVELRKQRVTIDVTSSSSWTRLLAGIPLPMLLFLGFIVVAGIIRVMRGGKVQSDSAMPMHPMQGMIGMISGLFGKQPKAADSPTHDRGTPKSG